MTLFPIKLFLKDKLVFWTLIASLVLVVFLTLYLRLAIKPTDKPVILRSTVHFGVDYLGGYGELFLLPTFALFFLIFNCALAYYFYRLNKRISQLLLGATVWLELAILAQGFFLVFLNY